MTARDLVFDCFPDAVIIKQPAPFDFVVDSVDDAFGSPLVHEDWVVVSGPEFDAEELGRGRSETEAWFDAAGLLGNQAV